MFTVAHAEGEDAAKVAITLAREIAQADSGANLGFVYVTDRLVESFPSMLETLRKETRIAHWVGGSGMGVLARGFEYFDKPAAVAMAARLPADGFKVIPTLRTRAESLSAEHQQWIDRTQPPFGIPYQRPSVGATGHSSSIRSIARQRPSPRRGPWPTSRSSSGLKCPFTYSRSTLSCERGFIGDPYRTDRRQPPNAERGDAR